MLGAHRMSENRLSRQSHSCTHGHDLPGVSGPSGWLLALTPPEQPRALNRALEKRLVCSCPAPGFH